ncbi:MAG: YadA-like family protein, partial [Megasphaera micronuciformis]|nr:YadA-like family protein [Megasphaera micronuciformis]
DETNNKDHEVATLDDGMKFAGDDGQTDSSKVISKKLNTVVDIVGGADKTKLTDNNIGVNNVNGKLKVQLSKDLDLTAGGSVKMGDTTVNNGGITIKAPTGGTTTDVHLGSDGLNNGGNKITNVAKGTADTDAVNVSQLKDAKSELKADERHIKPGTYTVDSNGKVTMTYVDGNGDDVANEKAVIEGIAKNDLSNITNDGKNVITNLIDMENGNNTTVSSRKDATGKKIFKVDVDLSATNRKVDTAATGTGSVASGSAAGAAVVNKGTQFVAGDNMVVKRETMSGNDTDQKITYALNPNLQNIKSISSGTTTSNAPRIDFGSNTVTINNGNLSLGGNKITNLAPGTSSTDAVNLSQLEGARTKVTSNDGSVTVTRNENTTTKEITYDLHVAGGNGTPDPTIYNRLNNLGDEIQTVGALGAALGALKPIQYDPLEPTQIMAGYGNYRGTSALALGVAHYRNESLMLHAGMSWAGGSSHMMANAGVTWKLGHRDPETAIADRYRRGPISSAYALQQEMAAVKEENQGLKGEVADLKSENAEMKKNIAMLMAKLGM